MDNHLHNEPKFLKSLIGDLISQKGWDEKIIEHKLPEIWEEITGAQISKVSKIKKLVGGQLFIETESSTWRAELLMRRDFLIEELNRKLERELIQEIIIR